MKSKKKLYAVIAAVCLVVCIICAAVLIYNRQKEDTAQEKYDSLQQQYKKREPEKKEEDKEKEEPEDEKVVKPTSKVDFESLWEMNDEIYAWIEIPGTEIDYPVAQREGDDLYYLEHTIDGEKTLPGSIYTESKNAKDFSDFNTVMYGHNMKNGSMFAGLHEYESVEFLEENPYVHIYLPDQTLVFKIFAAVEFNDNHLMYAYDFETEEGQKSYLEDLSQAAQNGNGFYNETAGITENDKLLTLSTCTAISDHRFLVAAVLEEGDI